MKLKNFDNYTTFYSKDPSRFEKRVAIASKFEPNDLFARISNFDDMVSLDKEVPLVMWDKFSFASTNESASPYLYNRTYLEDPASIIKSMKGEEFIPRTVETRSEVKGLKFPIIGMKGDDREEYKTYHKFKSSEKTFPIYQEKILPRGRYEVTVMDGKPIHMIKRVKGIDFDADQSRFKWQDQLDKILKRVKDLSEANVFILHLIEKDNHLFLEKVSQEGKLNAPQSVRLYESLYESHYSTRLPTWFKTHIGQKYLAPHYNKKRYDALLLKPTGVINYEKLV